MHKAQSHNSNPKEPQPINLNNNHDYQSKNHPGNIRLRKLVRNHNKENRNVFVFEND